MRVAQLQPVVAACGRFRHYRTYRDKHALEFKGITDNSMQRYVGRLREAVIQYD